MALTNSKNGVLSFWLITLGLAAVATGCASTQPKSKSSSDDAVAQVIRGSENPEYEVRTELSNEPLVVWGQRLKNTKFDYPVTVNSAVEKWIAYFTGRGKGYFEKYLERGRYFIPEISKVLKQQKMPQDLVYLAMIESGFHNSAKSHARAVGPWQFIRATGVRYGLAVNYWVDERRETGKATQAAILYLRELYQEFGTWELAAAAYNSGEGKVRRAVAKYKTHNFWEIAKHRFFRHETRDYVPKIMAAAILTKNAEQFGLNSPFTSKTGVLLPVISDSDKAGLGTVEPTPKELAEEGDSSEDTADDPGEAAEEKLAEDNSNEEEEDGPAVASTGDVFTPSTYMVLNPKEQIIEYTVKGPADLFSISKAAELPYSTIKMLNPELLRWCTPPYMKAYRVKLPLSVKDKFLSTYNDDNFDRKVVFMQYKVRRGDDVRRVAHRFGVEADPIRELNNISKRVNALSTGLVISLPVPTGYKRVIASMYDEKPLPPERRRRRYRRAKRTRNAESTGMSQRHRIRPNISATAKHRRES